MWMVKTFLTLSGPPLMEYAEMVGSARSSAQLSFKSQRKGKQAEKEEVIDVEKLHKTKQEKISAWTMRGLIQVIQSSGLSTISSALDESVDDEQKETQITSEWEAKAIVYQIFKNVTRPGCKYIESKTQHWRPNHSMQLKDIEDVNKMKLGLYINHTINFQNFGEKANRRSDLVFEIKKIFGELGIKYNLLPQELHLSNVGSASDASR